MKIVRKRVKIDFIEENIEKFFEQQSKLTSNCNTNSFTIYDSYTFKQTEVFMERPIFPGFAVLEFSELLMYETYYDK